MKKLTEYILTEYYEKWCDYRSSLFEPKWARNLAHYRLKDYEVRDVDLDSMFKKEEPAGDSWRSQTFIGLTRTKTMAGFSLVSDNLLQSGEFPFSVVPTPTMKLEIRDLSEAERDDITSQLLAIGGQMNEQILSSRADVELTDTVTSAALYGDGYARFVVNGMTPGLRSLSVWDIVRDYSTDRIQEGLGIIQRHKLSAPDVLSFVNAQEDVLDLEVVTAIMGQKGKGDYTSRMNDNPRFDELLNDGKFELLECFVSVPTHLLFEEDSEVDPLSWSDVIVYLLDGEGIGVVAEGVGKRPFYHVPWQRDIDAATNISIPDNVEDMQLVMNKAFRGFEDNKMLSGNVMGGYIPGLLDESNLEGFKIEPGKFFPLADTADDAGKAIQQVVIADVGQSYQSLISLADMFADEHSMIPKIAHGGSGGTEKTAFETSQQIDKAGKYIASVIRNFDENLIEPFANDVYQFNVEMETPGFVEGLRCVAQGYSSYNDRIIKSRKLQEFLQVAMISEAFFSEFSPKRIAEQMGASGGFDALSMLKTQTEKEEELERETQRNKSETELAEMQTRKLQAEIEKIQAETAKNMGEAAMLNAEGAHFDAKAETEAIARELDLEQKEADIEKTEAETRAIGRAPESKTE